MPLLPYQNAVMAKIIGNLEILSENQHFSQKIVPIANVLVFTCLLLLFAPQQHAHTKTEKKSQT